jgi:hypothetical protein
MEDDTDVLQGRLTDGDEELFNLDTKPLLKHIPLTV